MKSKETRQQFKDMGLEEAKKLLAEKQDNIRKLRFDIASKQVQNVREIRKERKDAARLMTIIREK